MLPDNQTQAWVGQSVVISEKMDGENTTIYADGYIHARSIDGRSHPSRDWVKAHIMPKIQGNIPENFRVCGENLYAKHSIGYEALKSYFLVFSVWKDERCLDWEETLEWVRLLELNHVPILFSGKLAENTLEKIQGSSDPNKSEGFVVRSQAGFTLDAFGENIMKFVRQGHVQTEEHWMRTKITPNSLKKPKPTTPGTSPEA